MAQLAKLLLSGGEMQRAVDLANRARELAPDDPEVERIVKLVLGRSVPEWHRTILVDEGRNAAYDAALRRAVRAGSRVLDIGAGSGLLAMMAARAGATTVVSCEMNTAMAGVAAEIVERNGYADRISIVGKHSRQLAIGADLAEPVDILVSEIVTNDLLGEDVLGCMEDAVGRLTRPDATIIPSHGAVRIALAYYGKLAKRQLASVQGFDLSPMNVFDGRIDLSAGNETLELRSEPADLFAFDFRSGGPFDNHRTSVPLTATGGDGERHRPVDPAADGCRGSLREQARPGCRLMLGRDVPAPARPPRDAAGRNADRAGSPRQDRTVDVGPVGPREFHRNSSVISRG